MERLNYFCPYESKSPNHEDQLTRAFLVVLKYIPITQVLFIEHIRNYLLKKDKKQELPSLLMTNQSFSEIETQVTKLPLDEASLIISVLMTDENWPVPDELDHRGSAARYDGVIRYGDIVITIENKPSSINAYPEQLNPDIDKNIPIQSALLRWRDIIESISALSTRDMLEPTQERLVDDFLLLINDNFQWISPFTNLKVCKGEEKLINRRCRAILEEIAPNAVRYHRGGGYPLEVIPGAMKLVGLNYCQHETLGPSIRLALYPGDTLNQARDLFAKLDLVRLMKIKGAPGKGWAISQNLHFSYQSTHLVWSRAEIEVEDYIKYWKEKYPDLAQIKRHPKEGFSEYFDQMLKMCFITEDDLKDLEKNYNKTNRDHLNPCPGLALMYFWRLPEAEHLDSSKQFIQKIKLMIEEMMNIWGQKFKPLIY